MEYRVLDLFSGIGGFSLGLEWAGMQTVAFCEVDGYARRVLRKHWPDVWLYEDIRTLTKKRLKQDGLDPNVIVGGFPCQDISTAGKGAGIEGSRSGLWTEMLRLIREIKPRWVVAENVPALRGRGADRVLADLEGAGYTAESHVVGAWAVGGDHTRDRAWIVAYPSVCGWDIGPHQEAQNFQRRDLGHLLQAHRPSDRSGLWPSRVDAVQGPGCSLASSLICRESDGISHRVDRLRCLGNAVVPLIPELIGRALVDFDRSLTTAEVA